MTNLNQSNLENTIIELGNTCELFLNSNIVIKDPINNNQKPTAYNLDNFKVFGQNKLFYTSKQTYSDLTQKLNTKPEFKDKEIIQLGFQSQKVGQIENICNSAQILISKPIQKLIDEQTIVNYSDEKYNINTNIHIVENKKSKTMHYFIGEKQDIKSKNLIIHSKAGNLENFDLIYLNENLLYSFNQQQNQSNTTHKPFRIRGYILNPNKQSTISQNPNQKEDFSDIEQYFLSLEE